jgi:hypothetical protein
MLANAVVDVDVASSLRPMGATAMRRGEEVGSDNRGIARPTLLPLLGGEWLVNALAHATREHSTAITIIDFMARWLNVSL